MKIPKYNATIGIMGLDLSLTSTGVVTHRPSNAKYFHNHAIKVNSRDMERLDDIWKAVDSYINAYEPDVIFLEGYAFAGKGKVFQIGELGGVVKRELYRLALPVVIVPPTNLKKFICSNGNAKKELMREWVYRRYGIGSETLKTNDEVDAFGLCMLGEAWLQYREGIPLDLTKKQIEALEKI